jgi:hypothetical protein
MGEPAEREGRPSVRQAARRAALAAQAELRAHRQRRDKRLAALATDVLVALGQRDAAVLTHEQRAGAALRQLLDGEHVTVAEAAQWCGARLTPREISRLRRLGDNQQIPGRGTATGLAAASGADGSSSTDVPAP